jgi:hypothetical protein
MTELQLTQWQTLQRAGRALKLLEHASVYIAVQFSPKMCPWTAQTHFEALGIFTRLRLRVVKDAETAQYVARTEGGER